MHRIIAAVVLAVGLAFAAPAFGAAAWAAPDLIVTPNTAQDAIVQDRYFNPAVSYDTCSLSEGSISTLGWHRLLNFSTYTANIGADDLRIGNPSAHPEWFYYSPCHGHWHFREYALYELLDATGTVVGYGHKQAFCIVDDSIYDSSLTKRSRPRYTDCDRNQGLSRGWYDLYGSGLDGQWIDLGTWDGNTDTWNVLPSGAYTLRVTVNYAGVLPESNYSNNTASFPVTIP